MYHYQNLLILMHKRAYPIIAIVVNGLKILKMGNKLDSTL
jgi:hypothetical protein